MMPAEAYNILGVKKTDSLDLINQTYQGLLKQAQKRLLAGNPLSIRMQAEQQIADLTNAVRCLQMHHKPPRRDWKKKVVANGDWLDILLRPFGVNCRATLIGISAAVIVLIYLLIIILISGCGKIQAFNPDQVVNIQGLSTSNEANLSLSTLFQKGINHAVPTACIENDSIIGDPVFRYECLFYFCTALFTVREDTLGRCHSPCRSASHRAVADLDWENMPALECPDYFRADPASRDSGSLACGKICISIG